MKKRLENYLLAGICILFSARVVLADETKPIVFEHNLEVAFGTSYFEYEEPKMEEDGFMYGVVGNYTYHGNNKLMINASLEYSSGDLDYDGEYWDGTPARANTDDWIVECRASVGYDYVVHGKHLITPFVGLGYRYWNDDIDGSGGYEREVEYWYTPIGLKTVTRLSDNWRWGIGIEYDLFWGGKVKSHLSDANPGYNDPSLDQDFGDGYGVRFSLRFTRDLHKNYALSVEPYITYWDIDESDTSILTSYGMPTGYYVYEPENDTTSYGLRMSLEF